MVGGLGSVPARKFVVSEVAAMMPRAFAGEEVVCGEVEREKVGNRKAVIPGLV